MEKMISILQEEIINSNQGTLALSLELEQLVDKIRIKNEQLKKEIKERKQIAKELQLSNSELKRFAYISSHDLKTPLRMIVSFSQLLQKRYMDKLDQEANDYMDYIVKGAYEMNELIDALLEFLRIDKIKLYKEIDLRNVLKIVLNNLNYEIKKTQAEITSDELPVIIADKSQMISLFQNLIFNAIKFHDKEPPRIHISSEVNKDEYIFSVKDNGIGIDPKYFNRIFIIFQRLHKKSDYEGTGIGLSICKKIIELHNGKIWVESIPGKGSIFYFSIPIRK